MRFNLVTLAKIYIFSFGLFHFTHIIPLLGVNEIIIRAPHYLTLWWWHLTILLVYGAVPIISALTENEKLSLVVTGAALIGVYIGASGVLTMTMSLHYIFALLSSLAAIFSLLLAAEKVALEVSAEILSLGWSQF